MRRLDAVVTFVAVICVSVWAQKPGAAGRGGSSDGSENDIHLRNATLRSLIAGAYQVSLPQVIGPGWLDTDRLDLVGFVPPGTTREQVPHLLQVGLEQQFHLIVHRESRKMTAYLLELAPGGAKLDPTPSWNLGRGPGTCDYHRSGEVCERMSMVDLAHQVESSWPGVAPVFDQTGLKGAYDFELGRIARAAADMGSNLQWLQFQLKPLGLTIRQHKQPVEVIVVDHCAKKPVTN